MIYDVVKIAHLASIVLWIGSAFTVPMVVLALAQREGALQREAIAALRQGYVWVGSIGIVATWVFGLTLLSLGGWFDAPWMWAKLAVVIVLSGLHGALSGRLQRLSNTPAYLPLGPFKGLVALHAIGLLAALTLVILKPF